MNSKIKTLITFVVALTCVITAHAISGNYDDPGGGTYWCNVHVHDVAASKSYGWCTGDDENTKMEEFRGFECANNGKVTTENPWVFIKFRYNKKQSKDYNYVREKSKHDIWVITRDGKRRKLVDASEGWTQIDKSWGPVNCSWDNEWFYFRFAPNERGMQEVVAIDIDSDSHFLQKNNWYDNYWFKIRAHYVKEIDYSEMSRAREAKIVWTAPGKMVVSADNSWLPQKIGNNVTNFTFTTSYSATVTVPSTGKTYSSANFSIQNRGNGSAELNVPIDQDFEVKVTRNTQTKFTFEVGGDVSQSLNEDSTQQVSFANHIKNLTVQFNQVDCKATFAWEDDYLKNKGEYQIYRTLLNERGGYEGNRELAGSTRSRSFTDNASRGMEYGKRYRYEVFMQHDSWGEIDIPSNPEKLTIVQAAEATVSTMPVIPMHLAQDTTVTDNVRVEWEFGNVPKSDADVTFKVHRIEPDGTITRNYTEVTVARNAGKASFTDEKPASACTVYGYFLQLDLDDGKIHLYSDTINVHVLGVSAVTWVAATKGTAGTDVVIKWKARQVGTNTTLYNVQRRYIGATDWISIYEEEGTKTTYTYTDKTAEPGRYYEYQVNAFIADCEGSGRVKSNAIRDVGFTSSTGVISGRVQFEGGTAVGGVRVSLSRESDVNTSTPYHSRSVQEPGDALTFTSLADVVNDHKPFTLQMFVRPDSTDRVLTLMKAPARLNLKFNKDKHLYDLLLNDQVAGAIPAGQFSQVSLMCDGSKVTTYTAGNKSVTNTDNVSTTPRYPDPQLITTLFDESGASLDGWVLNDNGMHADYGWKVIDDAFASSFMTITAHKDVAVSEQLVGATIKASVSMTSAWGSDPARVTATMYGADNSKLGEATVCDDNTKHEDWRNYAAEFTIPAGTTYIRYLIKAKDFSQWKGYYGPRFKDMKMVVTKQSDRCLDGDKWVLLPDFTGNVDEVRLWNRVLPAAEITADVDRLISGESDGLKSYITFDEGLESYAFDISCSNGFPNSNHIDVGPNTRPSDVVPSSDQLAAYGVTNDKGEYEIRGVPYAGSGTRYSIYPTKGIHSFNPTSRSAFIGGTSLIINNADFIDVSSFKVRGTVRYSGTTIPVDSVTFNIDGLPCSRNGKLIMSDAKGEYELDVPIGNHYIEALRDSHTFEGAGRYPAAQNETYEFLDDTHIDFFDNTLAIVAGRIVGGETEGQKPLGYGVSQNNIGCAEITLTPLDHPQHLLNAVQRVSGTTVEWVANADDVPVAAATTVTASQAVRKGGNEDAAKIITITTDAQTGEFSALLPPIRYKVASVKFPKNESLDNDELFRSVPAIDLSHPIDTVAPDTIFTPEKVALPLFKCNKKLMLTYRSQPVMDITQNGAPAGAFGTDTIVVRDAGQDVKLALYDYDEDTRQVTYNYGYPVFQMGRLYTFKVKAYEPYTNNDSGKPKLYKDMLRDSIITFDNEMGDDALILAIDTVANGQVLRRGDLVKLESNQVVLDSVGEARYRWRAGIPSLTAPFTRSLNASMVINKQTKLWRYEGLTGIVFGVVPTGNNFITAGPSHVQMVLRDPPGDASSATWATDSVTTDYTYTVRGIHHGSEIGMDVHTTLDFSDAKGAPFFKKLTYTKLLRENALTWKYDVNKSWDNHTSVTYTTNVATSTSSNMNYVGRDGDVFIGYSTNYIIGAADKVGLYKNDQDQWAVGMKETIAMDEKFNTHFEYSQKYIETTLFDNIKRTRNSMLKHITSPAEIEEDPAVPTYYTYLRSTDAKYGTSNTDTKAWGAEAKDGFDGPSYWARFPQGYEGCDSVMWCNEIIAKWEKTLADNEEDKLKAFADAKYLIGNESFERGVTFTKTTGSSTKEVHNSVEEFKTGLAYKGKNGWLYDSRGALILSSSEIGYHQTIHSVDETTNNERFSYTLNDTQRGNAHSVDVYKSPHNWGPIFRTRGGQTRCPYEGETKTKYYRPGQTLDYATMRLDNPKVSMPVRNFVDIPAGQEAQVQVVFTNESEVHEELSPVFLYVKSESNPKGLQIFMDGQSLLNGTELWLQYGVPLTKTLTIKQSDHSILDYNDITLVIANTCQPSAWSFGEVSFSAHFVPAAPDITLELDKNILNQRAVQSGEQLKVTISDINRMFTGLKGIRLKYRFVGDAQWVTAHEWFTGQQYLPDGRETDVQSLLDNDQPNIVYNLELPDFDGNYIVAAESICLFGTKEYTNQTPEQTVIRDTRGPKLLGQAHPNTGRLIPTDDIYIRFNEAIRESYLTKDNNFFITGSLNDSQVSHDVSLQFNGTPIETDAYLPINNTSFSGSLWLKRKGGGSLIEHGVGGNKLSLSITDGGNIVADINGTTATSTDIIPADKWVFLAFNYVNGTASGDNTLTMLLAEDGKETMLFDNINMPDYNVNGRLTLGRDYTGMMHELVLWNKNTPVRTLLGMKDEVVAAHMPGLVGYWKMDEGHGKLVTDYARARNIHLPAESWNIENTNLAAHLDGEHSIKVPIGSISPRPTDSFVLEMWFRGERDANAGATLFSITDRLALTFDVDNSLVLQLYDNGQSSLDSNGLPLILSDVNYNDGNWHHFALNVHRGVGAVAYVDGNAVKTIPEQQIPEPAGDNLYIGSRLKRSLPTPVETTFFKGDVDEIRLWNVATDGTSIIANCYNQVDTAKVSGLIAYYPMERSRLDASNNIINEFSLDNKAPGEYHINTPAAVGDGITQAATAPALRTSPLKQNLDFDFTASNNEIFINLNTLPARMQGNLLTFTVKNVRDMQDNLSETITWSAEVDYRTLAWAQYDGVDIDKGRLYESTITTTLWNLGRESENYTITGMPSWVTVTNPKGVLGINQEIDIQIIVGANAPLGNHIFYLYAVNDDDISTPLPVRVYVWGNTPSWNVEPSNYESSMNFIGQIYFDDKICSNPNTIIAAFVDGECRGIAEPKLVATRDAYFVNMTVYGLENITKQQPVNFRIYDADRGVVLSDVSTILDGKSVKFTYAPNGVVGSYDVPVKWVVGDLIEQTLDLRTGWNWISFYVEPEQGKDDLESVFGHSRVFNTIKSKEGFAMNSGTAWEQTALSNVTVGNLYKVKVKADARHTVSGKMIDTRNRTQTIKNGWNWIGPLSIYNLSLSEAFADLNPMRGDMVKSKEQVAFYDGHKWEGELTALIPGMGYYYRSHNPEDVTFHYPSLDYTPAETAPAPARRAPARSIFRPVDHYQFSDNMNVVARVMVADEPVDTLTLAAFVNNECRGVTRATPSGYYMLTIAGNASEAGSEVTFETVIDGEVATINEKLTWGSDLVYGDLDVPVILNVQKSSDVTDVNAYSDGIVVSPTLVRDMLNVRSAAPLRSVAVFTTNGSCITRLTDIDDNNASLNLSNLNQGIYLVEAISVTGYRVTRRIVKL